ncbi:hypothetical protein BDN72DRAFT_843378 [Pluteus cervinus]|uniref:Uncharacterized protein n=1 Tax=Pluteus cervinus TaxID=181527 RepID=A0ACD3AMR3_9AGAR|nr:hypothetical protein BDN72DRAFT_843378 [Pluteus cervinus]
MELKLVYRILRKISDWTLDGYFSEVLVEGQENVPKNCALIIASSHHNEIIDIATLAATMPHRRHLSFWAKSTMFANPIAGAILSSSGAIPVKRNPNTNNGGSTTSPSDSSGGSSTPPSTSSQASLFLETSKALARGEVIGVFPEGTSYTEPGIVQMMSGAAWAAVDYAKWIEEGNGREMDLVIVPVGIVYTDKSRYLSRICVRYGKAVRIADYTTGIKDAEDKGAASRNAVKDIMKEVEGQVLEYTVNAPDWDTLYAALTARDLLWTDEHNIPLQEWVSVSQILITLFSRPTTDTKTLSDIKASLTKYRGLLHYTNIRHAVLESLLPPMDQPQKSLLSRTASSAIRLPIRLLTIALFIPPFLVHMPAYFTGKLFERMLAAKGEEEAKAQFKAVGGGIGLGGGIGVVLGFLWKTYGWKFLLGWEGKSVDTPLAMLKVTLSFIGMVYTGVWAITRWHNALVGRVYYRTQQIITSLKIMMHRHPGLTPTELEAYGRPPLPPANPYIKRKELQLGETQWMPPPRVPVSSLRLVGPLLRARVEAYNSVARFLAAPEYRDVVEFLKARGARVPLL